MGRLHRRVLLRAPTKREEKHETCTVSAPPRPLPPRGENLPQLVTVACDLASDRHRREALHWDRPLRAARVVPLSEVCPRPASPWAYVPGSTDRARLPHFFPLRSRISLSTHSTGVHAAGLPASTTSPSLTGPPARFRPTKAGPYGAKRPAILHLCMLLPGGQSGSRCRTGCQSSSAQRRSEPSSLPHRGLTAGRGPEWAHTSA